MKKLFFVALCLIATSLVSCEGCANSSADADSTYVDSVVVDSVDTLVVDTVDSVVVDSVVAE